MSIIDYPDLDSDGCVLGPTIDVTWDAVGLDQISSAGLPLVDPTSYDAATGLMTTWKTASGPNGLATVEHSVAVDGTRPRPQQIKAGRSGALSAYFDSGLYEYDAAGNVTGFNGWTYQYDGLQRLTDAITPTGFPRSFTYDDFGNLTEVKDDGVVVKSIAVNAATNRLNGTGMAYDLRGNLVAEPVNGWTRNLRFDIGNRLVASWATGATAPSEVFGFAYDFTGECVLRYERDGGMLINAEVFLRDLGGNLLTELQCTPFDGAAATSAGSWARIQDHVYLGRNPVVRVEGFSPNRNFTTVVSDHLGSTRAEVTGVGLSESFTYWPFGELTQVPDYASLKGPHLFTAHEREHRGTVDGVMMGLDYMHPRYYSSELGRFLSVDPVGGEVGSSQSWNGYAYVLNNPLHFTDPSGKAHLDPNSTEEEIRWVGDKDDEVLVVAEDPELTVSEVRGTMLRVAGGGATTEEVPWNPEPALEFSYSTPSITLPVIGVPVLGDVTASMTPEGMTADFSIAPGYSPSGQLSALFTAEMTFGTPSNAPSASLDLRGGSVQLGGGVAVSTDFANYTSVKGMVGFGAGGRVKVNYGQTIPVFSISRVW